MLDNHQGMPVPAESSSDVEGPLVSPPDSRMLDLLLIVGKQKRFVLKFLLAGAAIGVALALLLPRKYEAVVRVMPPQQSDSVASTLLTQLGPLAGFSTRELGLRSHSDVFIALLHSRSVADDLVRRFSLLQVYGKNTFTDARKRLDRVTEIDAGKEGVITIRVRDRSPERAMAIANGYVEELRSLSQTLAITEAGRRRIFFEHEVQSAAEELARAETAMKQTQETTGVLQLDSQSKALLEAYMSLRAQVAVKEVQIASMGFAAPDNPDLLRAQQELAALRAELSRAERGQKEGVDLPLRSMPSAGLEYVRHLRELKYRESVYELLLKQYEIARIDEGKDAAIIQVIDAAILPELQVYDWPVRTTVGIVAAAIFVLLGIVVAVWRELYRRARQDARVAMRIDLLKSYYLRRSAPASVERKAP